ncbi:serine hydrolase [Luteimonas sp. A649]
MTLTSLLRSLAVAGALVTAAFPASAAPPEPLSAEATEALAAIERAGRDSHSDALLVMRDGDVLLEQYGEGERGPIELMSATKSVVALGIGLLLADGHLDSLDAPVSTWYPEWRQGRKADITVRMLLDHTSGLQNSPNAGAEIYPAPDVVQLALAAELTTAPGEAFAYNNKATNLLAGVIHRASGQPMDQYLGSRLFAPLGMQAGEWHRDDAGNPHAMAGLPLSARDAARLGQLLLDGGRLADGTRLLPEGFVDDLFAPSAHSQRVGLLWWRLPEWERVTLRDDAADRMAAKGVDAGLITALETLDGRIFGSVTDALQAALGNDYADRYMPGIAARDLKRADLFDETLGPVVAYEANGYLGQYIVVVPEQRLVAVRQIRSREAEGTHPADSGYARFSRDVIALGQALAGDAAGPRAWLVRHAEAGSGPDPALTPAGVARADAWYATLGSPALRRVYATDTGRSRETAGAIAADAGVEIDIYDPAHPEALVQRLLERGEPAVVVAHSNTLNELAQAMGADLHLPAIAHDEHDRVYAMSLGKAAKARAQDARDAR